MWRMLSRIVLAFLTPISASPRLEMTVTSEVEEQLVTGDVRTCGFDDTDEGWLNGQPFELFEAGDGGIPALGGTDGKNIRTGNGISPPWNSNHKSRFVELVLVVDTRLYIQFGRRDKSIHEMCQQIAKKINSIFLPLNIYVFLVGVVIWREYDQIQLDPDADLTLRRFLHYRKKVLSNSIHNDNAQLLTGMHFDKGIVGKALKGPICTRDFSGGVNVWDSNDLDQVAATVSHELGHNLGLDHDTLLCSQECPGPGGCLMSPSAVSDKSTRWSSCSRDDLLTAYRRGLDYCLRNIPQQIFSGPVCGNSVVEEGEECDCGLDSDCTNSCCQADTCTLRPGAACADGACCLLSSCSLAAPLTQCRPAAGECDLAEVCDGQSPLCPPDDHLASGLPCSHGFCHSGHCASHLAQCQLLWGEEARPSHPRCFSLNTRGDHQGNCGFKDGNRSHFQACRQGDELCGLMHCQHDNEKLQIGLENVALLSKSFIPAGTAGEDVLACRTALVDLGLNTADPGLAPAGARCGHDKMCLHRKCVSIESVMVRCPGDCSGRGVCSSLARCHCQQGWTGDSCSTSLPAQHGYSLVLLILLVVISTVVVLAVARRMSPMLRLRGGEDFTVLIEKSASEEWHSRTSQQLPKPRAFQL